MGWGLCVCLFLCLLCLRVMEVQSVLRAVGLKFCVRWAVAGMGMGMNVDVILAPGFVDVARKVAWSKECERFVGWSLVFC